MSHYKKNNTIAALLGALVVAAPGCTDDATDAAAGTFEVAVYGEAFIEAGIPADEFADGWAVSFDTFLVSVGEVAVGDAPLTATFAVFDIARDSAEMGHPVSAAAVPGGEYPTLSYTLGPSPDGLAGNASEADLARMRDNGWAVFVAGTATKDGEQVTFAWGFSERTRYAPCELASVARIDGSGGAAQLTIHGDHLFYDDLVAEEPQLRFQLIADSDADGDGAVTMEELAGTDIRGQDRYQVGSADVTDLRAFVTAQVATLGHIDGEGHCDTE